jgi:ATP-dependent DNA ligase
MLLQPPLAPMEARSVEEIPAGYGWQYEPKWDGFRCMAFRDSDKIYLQSKSGQPLARYFPDVVDALASLPQQRFVLDGELVVPVRGALSFNELQLRLHPAASRVQKLAKAHPAIYIVFDLLAENDEVCLTRTLAERRRLLERFAHLNLGSAKNIRLSPAGTDYRIATDWFRNAGGDLDGIIAKRLDAAYASGERSAAVKVKQIRTVDCVVGGFRYARGMPVVGSLLLGLYADDGLLHHVGFTSAFKASERRALTKSLKRSRNHLDLLAVRPELPAVGARIGLPNGNQSLLGSWSKWPMTISPAADSDTAQSFSAGVRTKTLASAQWTRYSTAKASRLRFCDGRVHHPRAQRNFATARSAARKSACLDPLPALLRPAICVRSI